MTVASRLRGAFAIYIALLAAVVVYHVRTIRRAVNSGHALTEISSRMRASSTDQLVRIAEMESDAEKLLVTRDRGYFERLLESDLAFGAEVRRLESLPLSPAERSAANSLAANWRVAELRARAIGEIVGASDADGSAAVARLQTTLDQVRLDTQRLGAASQDAMSNELELSERSARAAERLSWIAAVVALVLSIVLSALLERSIVSPLERLAEGTREVSAGRFDYRLDASSDDEFAQVARDFNSMTLRLDELDRMKRDFVSKVSHDLKTPLSSMQETIGVLLDEVPGPLSPKQRQLLELNLESNRRLAAMLNKLLDLSRLEAGLEPEYTSFDVTQVVRGALDRADGARAQRRVSFAFDEHPERLTVRGDRNGIAQVVDNLLENAIKFSPEGGTVHVHVGRWPDDQQAAVPPPPRAAAQIRRKSPTGRGVLITVGDEGPGIPNDEKERVFTRFYQTEAGRAARGRGVGLGLTICREIVTAHGGAIWVADNEPRGSVFEVLLPEGERGDGAAPPPLAVRAEGQA